jgi:hypothetical protein
MPTFLSDPTQGFYLALIAFAVITGAIFAKRQDKKSGTPFAVALLVLLLVYLGDKSGESMREEAVRRATAMANAAHAKNPDAFVEHIAETFEYTGEQPTPVKKTRAEVKASPFWNMLRQIDVSVTTWGYDRSDVKDIGTDAVEIGFMAKGEAQGKFAMFYKQGDGSMKLTALATFDPANHTQRVSIPGF